MSTASREQVETSRWREDWDIWRCPDVPGAARRRPGSRPSNAAECGADYRIDDGILVVKDRTADNNGVAQDFYDSPLWPKFRFWEKFTWFCNGGERRARNAVLRHLPDRPQLDLLDVAIGDGVYLDWLPKDWRIAGVDISRSQLDACRRRAMPRAATSGWPSARPRRCRWPTASSTRCSASARSTTSTIPRRSLREMVRVARPGAPIVVSDELPNLTDRMLGHKLGLPGSTAGSSRG